MPLQIYMIADGIGAGIQGAFYRYQVTSYGTSFITVNQDAQYVISGMYEGRTALSIISWIFGDALIVIATIMALLHDQSSNAQRLKAICSLLIMSGVLFLMSAQLQYGLFLYGAAGIVIPFGIVLIICAGGYFYMIRSLILGNEE
jgi:CHASE2 domain-containing sensor protein